MFVWRRGLWERMLNELQLRGFLVHSYIDNDEKNGTQESVVFHAMEWIIW